MPFESKAQQRWAYANKPKMAREWTNEMRGGKNASKYRKEHPIKAANLPEKVKKGLTPQPRFSGNGGHGKRITEQDALVSKRGTLVHGAGQVPGRSKLLASAREVESHAFQTVKPKAAKKPQKVWEIGKGDNKDVRAVLEGDRKYRQGHLMQAGGYGSAAGAAYKWGTQSGGGSPRGKVFWGLAGAAPVLVAGGKKQVERGRKQTRGALSRIRARGGSTDPDAFAKRERTYDSELNRQRRQGMYTAGGAAGSAALGVSAARDIRRTGASGRDAYGALSRLRDPRIRLSHWNAVQGPVTPSGEKPKGKGAFGKVPGGASLQPTEQEALERIKDLRSKVPNKDLRRIGGKIGGAAALGGGSLAMYRHSRSKANRRWN